MQNNFSFVDKKSVMVCFRAVVPLTGTAKVIQSTDQKRQMRISQTSSSIVSNPIRSLSIFCLFVCDDLFLCFGVIGLLFACLLFLRNRTPLVYYSRPLHCIWLAFTSLDDECVQWVARRRERGKVSKMVSAGGHHSKTTV